jgi:hypothetical protein
LRSEGISSPGLCRVTRSGRMTIAARPGCRTPSRHGREGSAWWREVGESTWTNGESEEMTTEQGDLSTQKPHRSNYGLERDWSKSAVPEHRCRAHRKNGEQCKNASLIGSTVCRYHGGAAKQCVNAARVRLRNAAEKLARELRGMATDPNVSDSVKLAAIRDELDRAGLKPTTTVDLEVSTKPCRMRTKQRRHCGHARQHASAA